MRFHIVVVCLLASAAEVSAAISSSERSALLALYNSTSGASWTRRDGWSGAAGTECSWRGVKCDQAQTTVIAIELQENNLAGTIPLQIGQLTSLETLDLTTNRITGTIPREIRTLTKLQRLAVSDNQMSGPLTSDIGALTTLRELEVWRNGITGPLPAELANLRNLELIDVGENPLKGAFPAQLLGLTNLRILAVYLNELEGPIPSELWRMTSLVQIWISGNKLTGTIPPEVANLSNLEYFVGWRNEISGPIPVELASLKKLSVFSVAENKFTGGFPVELAQLTELWFLDLSSNSMEIGTLPGVLGNLSKLEYLGLAGAGLVGTVPPELGALRQLEGLDLSFNDLVGVLPESLGQLTKLELLNFVSNEFTGPIPHWIAGMTSLTYLNLGSNRFDGTVPSFFWNLQNLTHLLFGSNRQLKGRISPEIRNLKNLEFLSFQIAQIDGALPAEIGELKNLQYLFGDFNELSGPIPAGLWGLTRLRNLSLGYNHLEGTLPADVRNLVDLDYLNLKSNRLSGPLPRELGNLTKLEDLGLSYNAFRGEIPSDLTNLTALTDDFGLDLADNLLYTNDPAVLAFIHRKDSTAEQFPAQTLTPTNVKVLSTTDRTATLQWDKVSYWYADGGIQVTARNTPNGPITSVATTERKSETSVVVRNLAPDTTYHFTVTEVTYPEFSQQNVLISDPAPSVSAATGPRVPGPPVVEETESPRGLVQVDGIPQNEDRFVLTNFGDKPSTVTLNLQADFATVSPTSFTLAPGASQIVVLKSVSRPAGSYSGYALTEGEGASNYIWIRLLSVPRSTGIAKAETVDSRIEVAGAPGSDSVGQARFRNTGDTTLVGMLVSDQAWLVPDVSQVFISAGLTRAVDFRVVRSRRPPGAEGTLAANLTLLFVADPFAQAGYSTSDVPPGISSTKVTVVDVSKPALSAATIPGFGGDVAYFLSGVASFARGGASFVSDVSLLNQAGAATMSDVRLYYTPAGSNQTSVATLAPIPGSNSVTLANVVSNVYGASSQVGSLQIRTANWQSLVVQAKLLGLSEKGTVAGDLPAFRSDRSLGSGQELFLVGVRKSSTNRTNLYLQETSGAQASVVVTFIDGQGKKVGDTTQTVPPFGMVEMLDAVPQGAVTVGVRNGATARVVAYARVFDDTNGENWSIVDWSRVNAFEQDSSLLVALVDGSRGGGRRRAVPHASGPQAATEVALFNPTDEEIAVLIEVRDQSGNVSQNRIALPARHTTLLENVGSASRTVNAHAVITPLHGRRLIATARSSRPGAGTSVPVVAASSGLRAGRSQIFSNLEDSTTATVTAALPGTYRTSFGLVETSGSTAVVRARIFLDEGRSLAGSAIYRDFQIGAGQQIVVDELVRAIVGASRDTALGDLHNLQLRIEVIDGRGSVVPFVVITDNATGDSLLRLE